MKSITKAFGIMALLLCAVFAAVGVSADEPLGVSITDLKVNGDSLNSDDTIRTQFERDSELEVKLQIQTDNSTNVNDVEVRVWVTGNKDEVSERTVPFDVVPNTIYTKTLNLEFPQRMTDQSYQLRVEISAPNTAGISMTYPLLVDAIEHSLAIKETTFSPNDKVLAGRAFTAVSRIKNYGMEDESDVKVVFSVPELGLEEVDYLNDIEKDETVSTEEVLLRIPANARSGEYTVKVTAYFDDYDDDVSASYSITVVGDDYAADAVSPAGTSASGKTLVSVGVQAQSVARGENGVIYPVTLTNNANVAKTYTLSVSGANDWATVKFSPSNVVILAPGETQKAHVYVAANENAAVGERVFSLDIKSGNDVVQQIPLKADVLESARGSAWNGVKRALTVAVIVLVVLIAVLAIVIGYQKSRKAPKDETEQVAQTYY